MLLVRHASAGARLSSSSRDRARKLDGAGRAAARQLREALASHPIERIVTSPHARCVETVRPLARLKGIAIERREELQPDAPRDRILALLDELPDTALVCTHREVFERLFDGEVTCEKGRDVGRGAEASPVESRRVLRPPAEREARVQASGPRLART